MNRMDTQTLIKKLNLFIPLEMENIIISPMLYDKWSVSTIKSFENILYVNLDPKFHTLGGSISVDGWLGQEYHNLFEKI